MVITHCGKRRFVLAHEKKEKMREKTSEKGEWRRENRGIKVGDAIT